MAMVGRRLTAALLAVQLQAVTVAPVDLSNFAGADYAHFEAQTAANNTCAVSPVPFKHRCSTLEEGAPGDTPHARALHDQLAVFLHVPKTGGATQVGGWVGGWVGWWERARVCP